MMCLSLVLCSLTMEGQQAKVDSLRSLLKVSTTDTARVGIMAQLTWSHFTIGQNDEAREVAQEIIDLAMEAKNEKEKWWIKRKAYGLSILGIIDVAQGKYNQSYRYQLEALGLRRAIADTGDIGGSLTNLGIVCYYLGDYPSAMKYYLESLQIAESNKDTDAVAIIYNNIGGVHEYLEEFDEALKNYQLAKHLREILRDQRGLASALNNIGNIYDYQEKYTESLENHFAALKINISLENKRGIAMDNDNIANTYSHMGRYDEEKRYRDMAMKSYEELGDQLGVLGCMHSLAASYYHQKKYHDAMSLFHRGLHLAKELGAKDRIADAYSGLASISASLGQFEMAYSYDTLYTQMKDSILNESTQKEIAFLKENYASEKKDGEIILLNRNAELISEMHKRRALSRNILIGAGMVLVLLLFARYRFLHSLQVEKIRNRISQDLHDDIGSTLSSISISSTAATRMDAERFPEIHTTLLHIGQNARSAMENMSDIVWAINPANDSFRQMIERIQVFGNKILDARNIKFNLDIPEVLHSIKLSIEQRKNIYLILREAIHNVAKYSNASVCVVSARVEKKRIYLTVHDDGIGISPTSPTLGGNGLVTMKHRADELRAIFEIQSETNKGTSISFQFAYS